MTERARLGHSNSATLPDSELTNDRYRNLCRCARDEHAPSIHQILRPNILELIEFFLP
jgi:hypothetical protein